MNELVKEKLEKETVRELDYAAKLAVESDAHSAIMEDIRKNCDVLNDETRWATEEYKAIEEAHAKKAETEVTIKENRKNRWADIGKAIGLALLSSGVTVGCYKLGLTFEEHGTISSFFSRNVLNRMTKP